MNLFFIIGPPAVGKMTVGRALAQRLDYRLFHNHHSIELALELFDYGDPEFKAINEGIRQLVFDTCAKSKQLKGFIFTIVWAFNEQEDWDYMKAIQGKFETNGWKTHFVELLAPLEVRLQRNSQPDRLEHKPSKRNLEHSSSSMVRFEDRYQMNSKPGQLQETNYLRIDNTDKSPEAVVDALVEAFRLT